jgi:RNA polymerase sigma-70 factor, ECF subfamily
MKLQMEYLKHLSQHDDAGAILNDLMSHYGKAVWDYAYIMTKRKEAADDLMQEVFLSAFQQIHSFRGDS